MKLLIPEGVIFEEVDHQVVLLSLHGGKYYKLNGTGTRVWELIQEHGDLEKIQATLASEFVEDETRIREEVAALVADLQAHGLVEVDAAQA